MAPNLAKCHQYVACDVDAPAEDMLAASDVLASAEALPFASSAGASAEDVSAVSVQSFAGPYLLHTL